MLGLGRGARRRGDLPAPRKRPESQRYQIQVQGKAEQGRQPDKRTFTDGQVRRATVRGRAQEMGCGPFLNQPPWG